VSLYCGDKTYKLTDKRDLQVVLLLFIVSAETCERTVCEREREGERGGEKLKVSTNLCVPRGQLYGALPDGVLHRLPQIFCIVHPTMNPAVRESNTQVFVYKLVFIIIRHLVQHV